MTNGVWLAALCCACDQLFADSAYVVLQVVVPSNVDNDMAAQFLVSTFMNAQTIHHCCIKLT